jgi:predicted metalloprotease with PDZ domain
MKLFLLILFTSTVCPISISSSVLLQSSNAQREIQSGSNQNVISYSIEPFYDLEIFRLIVVLEFKGEKSGLTRLRLPNNYGSSRDWEGVKFLKPLSPNTTIDETSEHDVKIVKYSPGSLVKIYYQFEQVRTDDIELGNHYMASLDKKYFHFLGETFFVYPDWDANAEFNFRISWNKFPKKWNFANSFGVNKKYQETKLPLWKFRHSVFTGGNFRLEKRMIHNNPIYVAIKGSYSFPVEHFVDMIQTILLEERTFWNDFNFPFFLVTVLPIEGDNDQGGTGRVNSFSLFLSEDRQIDYRMKRLLAHEVFHTWLGEKINLAGPESLLYWFSEGFSDYYARLLLLRAGLISLEDYISEYNKVLNQYFKSPVRNTKNDRIADGFWNDNDLNKLPYLRGDILAHNINYSIKKNSGWEKSLDDLMRDLYKRSQDEGLLISAGSLSSLIRFYAGEQTLADVMKVINQGTPIKAISDVLGPCVEMELNTSRKFWLFGEEFEVPFYSFNPNKVDKNCYNWFGVK